MEKKKLLEVIKSINTLTEIDNFETMIFGLRNFEIITYKEWVILLDALCERKEQIF